MGEDRAWPARTAVARTLIYDSVVPGSLPAARLSAITTPTLVLASDASDDHMQSWARGLPEAPSERLGPHPEGQWHGAPPGRPRSHAGRVLRRSLSHEFCLPR